MTRLRVFCQDHADSPKAIHHGTDEIKAELAAIGVTFERWPLRGDIATGATTEAVIDAYRQDIDRLMQAGGYQSCDVVSLTADHPDRSALRRKFLNEHTHAEDEVRFFVAGSGLFTLHAEDQVFEVLCEAGDLISVPHGMRHWFDMSESPSFVAIRLFTNPDGWVADFTGDAISARFPRYERAGS